jgi:hypothetical protein
MSLLMLARMTLIASPVLAFWSSCWNGIFGISSAPE